MLIRKIDSDHVAQLLGRQTQNTPATAPRRFSALIRALEALQSGEGLLCSDAVTIREDKALREELIALSLRTKCDIVINYLPSGKEGVILQLKSR